MSELFPNEREQALEARLVELEMRVSFQEQALSELSEALADARRAYQMEPGNAEYRGLYARMQSPAGAYRAQSQRYGTNVGFGRWCLSLNQLNLVSQLCSGGCCRGTHHVPGYSIYF